MKTAKTKKLLAIRFKALGDVAMTLPVLESLGRQYPDWQITLLSQPAAAAIYASILPADSNVRVMGINLKNYSGVRGLNKLYKQLKRERFDAVADLHDVIRSKWLIMRFKMDGKRVAVINKGREEKKALVKHTHMQQLATSFERYQKTFEKLGFPFSLDYDALLRNRQAAGLQVLQKWGCETSERPILVGIAPFAQHKGKVYPTENMLQVIDLLLQKCSSIKIFLLGGPSEKDQLEEWKQRSAHIVNCAGGQTLGEDIALLSQMDAVISMDSANMHLASLVGTPVVSIWGATHPYAGFLGYGQDSANIMQLPMICRPCSVFGNKPCLLGTYACMQHISPESVADRVLSVATQHRGK